MFINQYDEESLCPISAIIMKNDPWMDSIFQRMREEYLPYDFSTA